MSQAVGGGVMTSGDHLVLGSTVAAAQPNERLDLRELTQRILRPLKPDDRMVLTLVHLEERSIEETADLLGWSPSKVKVRAHRARKHLRAQLKNIAALKGL